VTASCPECGAPVSAGSSCQENFHALLFLEAEIPEGPGSVAHFYAVASYGLQHPESMGYTVATLEGLRSAVVDILEGAATIADIRRRVRYDAAQAGRVTRRNGDVVPHWPIASWPITVDQIVSGGREGYDEHVEQWARSVIAATTIGGVS